MSKMRIIFSIIFSITVMLNTAFAVDPIPNAGNFIAAGRNGGNLNTPALVNAIDTGIGPGLVAILQLLYQIGSGIAICIFVFMGIQILVASPQQKAQLKASLTPYFIGLLLFIAGVPIAIFIINIIISIF